MSETAYTIVSRYTGEVWLVEDGRLFSPTYWGGDLDNLSYSPLYGVRLGGRGWRAHRRALRIIARDDARRRRADHRQAAAEKFAADRRADS